MMTSSFVIVGVLAFCKQSTASFLPLHHGNSHCSGLSCLLESSKYTIAKIIPLYIHRNQKKIIHPVPCPLRYHHHFDSKILDNYHNNYLLLHHENHLNSNYHPQNNYQSQIYQTVQNNDVTHSSNVNNHPTQINQIVANYQTVLPEGVQSKHSVKYDVSHHGHGNGQSSTFIEQHHKPGNHHDDHGHDEEHKHDHDAYYKFSYDVKDYHTGDVKNHQEERNGDAVKGEYSLLEQDGNVRTVKYYADWKTGFHAQVLNSKG